MNKDIPAFFTNSEKVWVSENFRDLILAKYAPAKDGRDKSIGFSDLKDIGTESAPELVFTDTDRFLEQLASLIENQINGEEGLLLNDSSANYFFVQAGDAKLYSVLVRWEQAQRLWRCGAYLQEELKMPNVRIFYPAG